MWPGLDDYLCCRCEDYSIIFSAGVGTRGLSLLQVWGLEDDLCCRCGD